MIHRRIPLILKSERKYALNSKHKEYFTEAENNNISPLVIIGFDNDRY